VRPEAAEVNVSDSLNDYTKLGLIGQGGFCSVYRVADPEGNIFALKSLHRANFEDHLRGEYSALKDLNHRGIPRVYRLFEENGTLHMLQELIEGELVSFTYDYDCKMPVPEAKQLLQELLEIVQHIHSRGYVHCDIKPVNVIRRPADGDVPGRYVLVDFGAVASAGEWRTTVGTPGFRPPEQNHGRAFPATDLYAIGIAIASLLTGEREEVFHEDGYKPVQLPKDLASHDPVLATVLERMTNPSLDERYRSAQEALAALEGRKVSAPTTPVRFDKTIKMGTDERVQYRVRKVTRSMVMTMLLVGLIYANVMYWKPNMASLKRDDPSPATAHAATLPAPPPSPSPIAAPLKMLSGLLHRAAPASNKPAQRAETIEYHGPGVADAATLDTPQNDDTRSYPASDLSIAEADVSGSDPGSSSTDSYSDPERGKTVYFFAVLSREPTDAESSKMRCSVSLFGPDRKSRTVSGGKLVGNVISIPYRQASLPSGVYTWRVVINRPDSAPIEGIRQRFSL
jgi:serine/threonine protein kinase